LVLFDHHAKSIGDPNIAARAQLSPIIKSGNQHFLKYSMTGRIGLLISVTFTEALRLWSSKPDNTITFEQIISDELFHKQLNLFPDEISAVRLSLIAKETLWKYKNDYCTASFMNLMEWRQLKDRIDSPYRPQIKDDAYSIIIDESNSFRPDATQSLQETINGYT
jgi:hypothetical protein